MEKLNNSQLNRLFSNRYFNYTLFVLAGLFLGWLIFRDGHGHDHEPRQSTEVAQETIWTCSMHPQIRMQEQGDCPICGMDLCQGRKKFAKALYSRTQERFLHSSKLQGFMTS